MDTFLLMKPSSSRTGRILPRTPEPSAPRRRLPSVPPSIRNLSSLEERDVVAYLDNHPVFLERYVTERVPVEVQRNWLDIKLMRNQIVSYPGPESSRKKTTFCNKQFFKDLLENLHDNPSENTVLLELSRYISLSVGVDAYRIYKLYPEHPSFVQYFVYTNEKPQSVALKRHVVRAKHEHVSLVLDVAKVGTCRRVSRGDARIRFPETPVALFKSFNKNVTVANFIMYQPILAKTGKTIYVIEMWRIKNRFTEIDERISNNFLVLGSLALHYCNLYTDKKRERNMSDFLLEVVRAIFEEMVSLDALIKRILEFAQRLVNADRASLFLVDYRSFELVSTVFDLKYDTGHAMDMEKKEIRMPINRGIAGHMALSGETMNIPDAYSDCRFNRDVDEATGYKTVSILCMPIKVEGSIIGVVQMVNKRGEDSFDREDEVAFEVFASFFGLALHHARLYDRIMMKEQKYKVALEVLSYHNTCREKEVKDMLTDRSTLAIDLNNFFLDPFRFTEYQKCKCVIEMFKDLFGLENFDVCTLTRFVLTVKKNYRTVPYHNFDHGWTVAHSMYVLLKTEYRKRFSYNMRLALFVASLCHDLDHRGYTNKYMSEIASPLAAMYTTSTLEHHHFNITVTILQQEGHNIFLYRTSEDYKQILGYIKHCILATDLAIFFPNLDKLKRLCAVEPPKFDWNVKLHRELGMAISMTAADLSASAKPWRVQIKTVKVIFEEFYDQGDKERALGKRPIPMMDRNKPNQQPSSQVGFLSQICVPCYSILYKILPNTRAMYVMAMKNLNMWKTRADRVQREQEKLRKTKEEIRDDATESPISPEKPEEGAAAPDSSGTCEADDEAEDISVHVRSGIWKDIDRE